jgi:hypothetical protein
MRKERTMKTLKHKSTCILAFLFINATITLNACSAHKVLTKPTEPGNVHHFSELKGWDETRSLNNYVAYVDKGDIIPLAIFMDTDFMEFKQNQIELVAKKRLYFRVKMPDNLSKEELAKLNKITAQGVSEWSSDQKKAFYKNYILYVSMDAIHWAPLYGKNALKEVLGYKMGMVSFGMKVSTIDGMGAVLNIKTVK